MSQAIAYRTLPVVGSILRPAAFPHHAGWVITEVFNEKCAGADCLEVQLRSLHNGDAHGERWGVVAWAIQTGEFVMEAPAVAAIAA